MFLWLGFCWVLVLICLSFLLSFKKICVSHRPKSIVIFVLTMLVKCTQCKHYSRNSALRFAETLKSTIIVTRKLPLMHLCSTWIDIINLFYWVSAISVSEIGGKNSFYVLRWIPRDLYDLKNLNRSNYTRIKRDKTHLCEVKLSVQVSKYGLKSTATTWKINI